MLANYKTLVTNFGSYADYEFTPFTGFRISAALRYDAFQYVFVNYLTGSSKVGGPSTIINYHKLAPKIGFTYNHKGIGFYGNYSEGYVPPQITDVFGVSNSTYLLPQTFYNYELGGWLSLVENKLYADWSAYLMNGTNEIISVKLPSGISANENSGRTKHMGIEYGLSYKPMVDWYFRFSASNANHQFVNYVSGGVNYNGNTMQDAPHFRANAEAMYKPHMIKGLRIAAEWQRVGKYYIDNVDQHSYNGFNVVNIRVGYELSHFGIWINALNLFNEYYSTNASYTPSSGYTYQLGDPRAFTLGLSYKFGK